MTLFMDLQQGLDAQGNPLEPQVWLNLYTISIEDGNFGESPPPNDPTVTQVEFKGARPAGPTAARLYDLANTTFDMPIVVTGMQGGIDPYSGMDVTGNGFTYVDMSSSGFGGNGVVRVVYDLSQCNGQGIVGFDITHKRITTPNAVILYHELSHAFRAAQNQTDPNNDEIPAEKDENVMRGVLGLCLRDVNNHDGDCGSPADDCGGSNGDPNGCFIVSATTGSPDSDEVNRLRKLRERIRGVSDLGAQLLDVILQEYYQFSPRIAASLQQDPAAREAVLQFVVRPLLAWYSLAGILAFEQPDPEAVRQAEAEVLQASPRYFSSAVLALLEAVRSGEPLPGNAPPLLFDFAPRLQKAMQYRYAGWAIFDPLLRAWRAADQGLDLVDEVSRWLAAAPLEIVTTPSNPELLERELRALASSLNFKPMARRQLGERLVAVWPEAAGALKRNNFI